MSRTSAYYFYDEARQTLRHGHEFPDKPGGRGEHWHRAAQPHPDYPTLHDDIRAYDPCSVDWSDKNRHLYLDRKIELLNEAREQHDRAIASRTKTRDSTRIVDLRKPSEKDEDELFEAEASKAQEPPVTEVEPEAPASEDEIVELLAALPARVDGLEASQRQQLRDDMDMRGQVTTLRNEVSNTDTRVDGLARDVSDLTGRVVNFEEVVNNRFKPLEEAAARHVVVTIQRPDIADKKIHLNGNSHFMFQELLETVAQLDPEDRNIWLAGPAGSSKTTAARKLAEALSLPFDYHPPLSSPFELMGSRYVQGDYVPTAFRRIYENGGVILLDEVDGSDPRAMLALNGALSGPSCSFPDRLVPRHPDTIVICAANTWGHGGNANYIGRMAQDAAFLDRFVWLEWPYDAAFERAIAPDQEWTATVQAMRERATRAGAKIVISPRASIKGGQMLKRGATREQVVNRIFGRYRSNKDTWNIIGQPAEDFIKAAKATPTPTQAPTTATTNGTAHDALKQVDFSRAVVFGSRR